MLFVGVQASDHFYWIYHEYKLSIHVPVELFKPVFVLVPVVYFVCELYNLKSQKHQIYTFSPPSITDSGSGSAWSNFIP